MNEDNNGIYVANKRFYIMMNLLYDRYILPLHQKSLSYANKFMKNPPASNKRQETLLPRNPINSNITKLMEDDFIKNNFTMTSLN